MANKVDKIAQFQKAIPEDLGAVLITSPINRRYFTGFPSSAGTLIVTKKQSYFIIDSRYFEAATSAIKGCKVILQDKLLEQVKKLLTQQKVKSLGVESRAVTVSELRAYEEKFSGVAIATDDRISDLIGAQRAIKSDDEIASVRAAQKIADKGFLHILNFIEAGKTELEIAVELEQYCRRNGSEEPAFSYIIAAGKNSSMPHAVPSDYVVQTNDFVTMDFGCTLNGYRSDMTRTVAVGAVSPKQREAYETVLAAQLASIKVIKGGVACKKVDKVARDIIDVSEFKGLFGHGLGHCLGLEVHESPRCNTISTDKLETGMIMSVEPGVYLPGEFGLRIEDIVVVTKTGCDNLCESPKELLIL